MFSLKNHIKSASSVFKSRTNRVAFSKDDLPPPGAYEPFAPLRRVSGAQAAFRGTGRSLETKR